MDHRLQTDGTQFLRTQLIGVQQKTEEHIDTPDDLVEVQLEDVPSKPTKFHSKGDAPFATVHTLSKVNLFIHG